MIAYVSFVAITNLLLGMALARYLSPAATAPHNNIRDGRSEPQLPTDVPESEPCEETAAELKVDNAAVTTSTEVTVSRTPAPAQTDTPTLAALWNEFAAQLRDVSERVHYCRAAQDIALAQQAASRLKSFVREWYAQFEECLHREQPEEATQSAAPGQTLSTVEMFAAQLETTLSNIDALDYTQPVDEVLDMLNRELETLDRQRRSFAKSAEGDS